MSLAHSRPTGAKRISYLIFYYIKFQSALQVKIRKKAKGIKIMSKIQLRLLSSLERCYLDEQIVNKTQKSSFVMFQNEKLSFQVAYANEEVEVIKYLPVTLSGELSPYATVREVVNLPVAFPMARVFDDGKYERTAPGLYPDLLRPLHYAGKVPVPEGQLHALWIDITLPSDFGAGNYSLTIAIGEDAIKADVRVLNAKLPAQSLIHTEWFYTDCLAEHYHTRAFSEKHWKIIENFIRTAVENGINMILTPVFTPELDTYIGGERMTTQLVDITVNADGTYTFGFKNLARWIDLCLSYGIRYFEIPHFFTQWGAEHAPKFVATVQGRKKRIFGWETDAMGKEYADFLAAFIPALLAVFDARGLGDKVYFHVSDEPRLASLEQYTRCRELIGQYLQDRPIIDALSDYDFWESGALKKPIPAIKHISPFIENGVPNLWAYYCGAGDTAGCTNRYISMPLGRVRVLGVQLWLYHIEGFLHWGYNYYHNRYSYEYVDPFGSTDGEYFAPGGDTYLVYPGNDGEAWESLRLNAMREAMDDMRALALCESIHGREFTEKIVRECAGGTLTFKDYPTDAQYFIRLREQLIRAIEN